MTASPAGSAGSVAHPSLASQGCELVGGQGIDYKRTWLSFPKSYLCDSPSINHQSIVNHQPTGVIFGKSHNLIQFAPSNQRLNGPGTMVMESLNPVLLVYVLRFRVMTRLRPFAQQTWNLWNWIIKMRKWQSSI